MAEKIRRDLLSSLGLNSGDPQSDPYTQAFLKDSLATVQPQLENALIGRGLGGSSVYQGALSDLFSKLGTQATLNSQQYKTNALSALQSNFFAPQQTIGQNLLQLAQGNDSQQQQMAQQLYETTLPYLAKVNVPTPNFLQNLGATFSPIYHDVLSAQGYQGVGGQGTGQTLGMLASIYGGGGFGAGSPVSSGGGNYSGLQAFNGGVQPYYGPSYSNLNSPLTLQRY